MVTELSDSWFSLETFAGILHRGTAHFLPARTEWGNCEDGETHPPPAHALSCPILTTRFQVPLAELRIWQ